MASNDSLKSGEAASGRGQLSTLFESLTHKQHEVFELVADNWTSKEIAGRLGVTESAINQRIEAVRLRAGSLPRAQIARAYRQFRAERSAGAMSGHGAQAAPADRAAHLPARSGLLFSNDGTLPESLTGSNGRVNRVAAMVFIAAGLMMVAIGGLAVGQVLTFGLGAS